MHMNGAANDMGKLSSKDNDFDSLPSGRRVSMWSGMGAGPLYLGASLIIAALSAFSFP